MDNPPVNALTVAGWFDLADLLGALGRDPAGARRGAAGRGPRLQRRRRHQGDAGHRGLRRPHRRQPGLLRRLRRRLRLPGARRGRRQRLLPRGRHRPGRQRRRHRRRRRRHLRAARGRPRGAGRRHPPQPPRPPAQDAGDGVHVGHRDGRRSCTTSARCTPSCRVAELRDAAIEVAGQIAAKSPTVIRAAKESLNGIDPWDVKRSYRFEQGFTFELNLAGVADEHRDAFVAKRRHRHERRERGTSAAPRTRPSPSCAPA